MGWCILDKKQLKELFEVNYSFGSCFIANLQGFYKKWSKKYCVIQLGIVANHGIKTWKDLLMMSNDEIDVLENVSHKITDILIMMRNHAIFKYEALATKALFYDYLGGSGYYHRVRKYFGDGHVYFSWGMVCRIPYENLLKVKGIGHKTVHFIEMKKSDIVWAKRYKYYLDMALEELMECGK